MEDNHTVASAPNIRQTKFTVLRDQQCSLNMQIRLAMQLHDAKTQTNLEKQLKEVTDQIDHMVW